MSEPTAAPAPAPTPAPAPALPDWDMTPYFDAFDGPAYRAFRAELATDTEALLAEARRLATIHRENLGEWAQLLVRLEALGARTGHLAGYLGCLGAADARDTAIKRESAAAAAARAEQHKIFVRLRAALREADEALLDTLAADPKLSHARYFLGRLRESAQYSMPSEQEELAADLDVTGLSAWGRLYDQVSGRLEFDLDVPGAPTRRLPVSACRSLLEDPDPAVRRAAQSGNNAAWESVGDVVASCLDAISGTRLTLYQRRGVAHFLDPALFDAAIQRETLDAMLGVVDARAEVARRYLRGKAKLLGRPRLGFQDLMAPPPAPPQSRALFRGRTPVRGSRARLRASRRTSRSSLAPRSTVAGSTTARGPASAPVASARPRRSSESRASSSLSRARRATWPRWLTSSVTPITAPSCGTRSRGSAGTR